MINYVLPHHSLQRRDVSQSDPGSPSEHRSPWSSQGCTYRAKKFKNKFISKIFTHAQAQTTIFQQIQEIATVYLLWLIFFLHQVRHNIPDLPSEGTLGNFVAVLSSYAKLGVQVGPGKVQVDGWSATNNLWNTWTHLTPKIKCERILRPQKITCNLHFYPTVHDILHSPTLKKKACWVQVSAVARSTVDTLTFNM